MDEINERTTPEWAFDLIDGAGDPIEATALNEFTATLYDKETGDIINDRDEQNALNANQFTVDADGHGLWKLTPEDTAVLHPGTDFEVHVLLLEWTYNAGTKFGKYEYMHRINNLNKVETTSP